MTLEEALTKASPALRRKMEYSARLLRKAERLALTYDNADGYFLAFSGGKDSQALYHMAQLAGVRFRGHMILTSVDPPEVIRFVKRQYPDIVLAKPKDSIYNIAVQRQILPTMRARWCCQEFKETAGAGKVTLIGIRHQESSRRAKRNEVEISSRKFSGTLEGLDEYRTGLREKRLKRKSQQQGVNITNATEEQTAGCISGKESLLISPIIHWTERDVWEFLNSVVSVPHCELYDQGWHRIGCINCPMASARQKAKENERWPHVKRNWIKAIMRIRAGGGITEQTYTSGGANQPTTGQAIHNTTSPSINSTGSGNSYQKDIWRADSPREAVFGGQKREYIPLGLARTSTKPVGNAPQKGVLRNVNHAEQILHTGFSDGSSSDGLTEEQERETAENIYDWWISGKGYKQWYAEKFLQTKIDFNE